MSAAAETLTPAEQPDRIKAYDEFRAQLAELEEKNSAAAFDYETPKGNREARSHIHSMRQIKGAVEKRRKQEKAASLEYGRRVDGEAREIASTIDQLIAVHAEPLREIEEREEARVAGLRERLDWFAVAMAPVDEDGEPWGSNYLASQLAAVRAVELDDSWQEFLAEVGQAKDAAVTALERHVAAARKREEEAAELERLREEQAAAAKREEERRIAEAAATKAREEAEARARAERQAAEREAREKQEAHDRAIREAEEKAEQERQEAARALREQQEAAERRELELKLEAERKERERLAAEEQERKEREARERDDENRRRVLAEIAAAIAAHSAVDMDVAEGIAQDIAVGVIPHVTVTY